MYTATRWGWGCRGALGAAGAGRGRGARSAHGAHQSRGTRCRAAAMASIWARRGRNTWPGMVMMPAPMATVARRMVSARPRASTGSAGGASAGGRGGTGPGTGTGWSTNSARPTDSGHAAGWSVVPSASGAMPPALRSTHHDAGTWPVMVRLRWCRRRVYLPIVTVREPPDGLTLRRLKGGGGSWSISIE